MRKILDYLDHINDELSNAKECAENYLQLNVEGNQEWAIKYKTMAEEKIQHASNFHELATINMEKMKAAYTLPMAMLEVWDKANSKYVEQTAWIMQMLAM